MNKKNNSHITPKQKFSIKTTQKKPDHPPTQQPEKAKNRTSRLLNTYVNPQFLNPDWQLKD